MRFANPDYLFLLALIPILLGIEVWRYRKSREILARYSDPPFSGYWIPRGSVGWWGVKLLLLAIAALCLILALARPQGAPVQVQVPDKPSTIFFVVDCSSSMLARDARPDRFQAAKQVAQEILERCPDKHVGLIAFTQEAQVVCPITYDHYAFLIALKQLKINSLSKPGSDPAAGLALAIEKLGAATDGDRAIVLLTDGEANQKRSIVSVAKEAKSKGVPVFSVGFGTLKGARIPLGKDFWGNPQFRTHQGKLVRTRLQALGMRKVSKISGAEYTHWQGSAVDLRRMIATLKKMSGNARAKMNVWTYQEYFPWLVLIAFLCLAVETVLPRKGRRSNA